MGLSYGRDSEASAVINIVRMYAYQNGVTNIFDVPREKAKDERRKLAQQGWVIYHTVLV